MEMILIKKDLWEVTSDESKRPGPWYESPSVATMPAIERMPTTEEAKEQKEWDRTSCRAYVTISLAVSEDCRVHITGIKDPKAMWNKLKALFEVKRYTAHYLTFKELVMTTLKHSAS